MPEMPEMPELIELKTLTPEIQKKLCESIADSFEDYPFSIFFTGGKRVLYKLEIFYQFLVKVCIKRGKIFCTDDYNAVSLWLPPGKTMTTFFDAVKFAGIPWFFKLGPGFIKNLLYLSTYMEKNQLTYQDEKSWYLFVIAVRKAHQGKKLASALLKRGLAEVDRSKNSCYLETGLAKNVEIYKRFGFELMNSEKVPKTDITLYAMLRKPHS